MAGFLRLTDVLVNPSVKDSFQLGIFEKNEMATPAGIEPATNSLEVVRKLNSFNDHSDKTALSAALSNKTKFQFVGMARVPLFRPPER
jgi:hypothetical protein